MNWLLEFKGFRERLQNLDWSFEEAVNRAWELQRKHNSVFRQYLDLVGRNNKLNDLSDITFLPISFFKHHDIRTGTWEEEAIFKSSGTGSVLRSQHYIDSLNQYGDRCLKCLETRFPLQEFRHHFWLPFYQDNPNSSLIKMAERIVSSDSDRNKFLTSIDDVRQLAEADNSQDVVLWTVGYGVLDLLDEFSSLDLKVTLVETGGMKGKREELSKRELHDRIRSAWAKVTVSSEYGMCELFSQSYLRRNAFQRSENFGVRIGDEADPFLHFDRGRGQLSVMDLYNIHSCCFIQTEDLAIVEDEGFQLLGRLNHGDVRGCNLLYVE